MTVMNEEVYDALKSVGVDDEKARREIPDRKRFAAP